MSPVILALMHVLISSPHLPITNFTSLVHTRSFIPLHADVLLIFVVVTQAPSDGTTTYGTCDTGYSFWERWSRLCRTCLCQVWARSQANSWSCAPWARPQRHLFLLCYIAQRWKTTHDYAINFVDAKQLTEILGNQKTHINSAHPREFNGSSFLSSLWRTVGSLRISMKYHCKQVTTNVKPTFEKCSTVITQIKVCLNSCTLLWWQQNWSFNTWLFSDWETSQTDLSPFVQIHSYAVGIYVRNFWQRWVQAYLSTYKEYLYQRRCSAQGCLTK